MSTRSRLHPWWGPRRPPEPLPPLYDHDVAVAGTCRWLGIPTPDDLIDDFCRLLDQISASAPPDVAWIAVDLPRRRIGRKRAHWRRLALDRAAAQLEARGPTMAELAAVARREADGPTR